MRHAVPALAALLLAGCSSSTAGRPSVPSSSAPATSPATTSGSAPSGPPTGPATTSTDQSTPPASATGSASTSPSSPPSSAPATTAPPTRTAVIVTFSGWDAASRTASAAAFVPSVLVPSATCTLVLRRDGLTYRVPKAAVPTANSMQCGTIQKVGLAAGNWTGTVEFTSITVRGTSAPFTIQVTS